MSDSINIAGGDLQATGVVSLYDVDSWEEYLERRGELHPAARFHNKLTTAFLAQAFDSVKAAITWQALGTGNQTPTITDGGCYREFYRKLIPQDGRGDTPTSMIFATFFGSAEATCAHTYITAPPVLNTIVVDSVFPPAPYTFPGFQVGDMVRIYTTEYEWRTIAAINTTTKTITLDSALTKAVTVGTSATVDQVISEAALHIIDTTGLDVQTMVAPAATRTAAGSNSTVTVTVGDTSRFVLGDYARVQMTELTPGYIIYECGTVTAKTSTTLTILMDHTDRTPTLIPKVGGTVQRGLAANHANNLRYVKDLGRSTVVETIITLTQV